MTSNVVNYGRWFNLTFTVASNVLSVYWNGGLDKQYSYPSGQGPNWPAAQVQSAPAATNSGLGGAASAAVINTPQPWYWNFGELLGNQSGSIKVKNVYFFNRAISTADIGNIAATYGTPATSGTSTYDIEPYEKD